MNEGLFCQSCGMPMQAGSDLWGTNSDQTPSKDYCNACYQDGKFQQDVSLEAMLDLCLPHVLEARPNLSRSEALSMLQSFLPTLKRWR